MAYIRVKVQILKHHPPPFRAHPAAPLRDEIDGVHRDQCEAFLSCLKLATTYIGTEGPMVLGQIRHDVPCQSALRGWRLQEQNRPLAP